MFGISTSQGFGYREIGVEENHKECVEDYGYDNLYLLRVISRVFSLKNTLYNMWVIRVYIVWVKTWWSRYAKIAK